MGYAADKVLLEDPLDIIEAIKVNDDDNYQLLCEILVLFPRIPCESMIRKLITNNKFRTALEFQLIDKLNKE